MRIRTIKPTFFKDEKLADLPFEVRTLFQGLWCMADSEGRLEYRPRYIKAEVFPYHDLDVPKMLKTLHDSHLIQIYEADSRSYIHVVNFHKHQRLSGKEAATKSEFPAPPPRKEANGKHWGSNGEATGKHPGSNGEVAVAQERKGKEWSMDIPPKNGGAPTKETFKEPTKLQIVIEAWKIQTGVDPNDRAWDREHYKRHLRPAQALLNLFSADVDAVCDCIETVYRQLVEKKGLDLSLQGVVKNSDRFRQEWLERKAKREMGRV